MEITLTMTAEEYDRFRAYQREKDTLEQELSGEYKRLRKRHEELCSAVISGLELEEVTLYAGDEIVETSNAADVKDQAAALRAYDLASEWYA